MNLRTPLLAASILLTLVAFVPGDAQAVACLSEDLPWEFVNCEKNTVEGSTVPVRNAVNEAEAEVCTASDGQVCL